MHDVPSYWRETNRPLVNLAFVAPLLVVYEGGLVLLGPAAMRNGADVWLRDLLHWLGFGQYFLLPSLTVAMLLAWHHVARQSWQLRGSVLYGMLLESIGCGAALLAVARVHMTLLVIEAPDQGVLESAGDAVSYVGAGIYEELVFRCLLLTGLLAVLQRAGLRRRGAIVAAVAVSSAAFALAHYQFRIGGEAWLTFVGEPFAWAAFSFRFVAGVIFSFLFLFRGFGIAVGAHALYDILVSW